MRSRAVVGFAIDDAMRTTLVTDALDIAMAKRKPGTGVTFHSDRARLQQTGSGIGVGSFPTQTMPSAQYPMLGSRRTNRNV